MDVMASAMMDATMGAMTDTQQMDDRCMMDATTHDMRNDRHNNRHNNRWMTDAMKGA